MSLTLVFLLSLIQRFEETKKTSELVRYIASSDATIRHHSFQNAMAKLGSSESGLLLESLILIRSEYIVHNRKITERDGNLHWVGDRNSEEYLIACLLDRIDNVRANDLLIQFVVLESVPSPLGGEWKFVVSGGYPVAGFLANKGKRVVPQVMKELVRINADGRRRRNLCWVLLEVVGPEKAGKLIKEQILVLTGKERENLAACLGLVTSDRLPPKPQPEISSDFNIR